ncbi:hypothetical protein LINPERHAP2_LOCUS21531 [Linum perenne]
MNVTFTSGNKSDNPIDFTDGRGVANISKIRTVFRAMWLNFGCDISTNLVIYQKKKN